MDRSESRQSPPRAITALVVVAVLATAAFWISAYQPLSSVSGGFGAGLTAGGGYDALTIDNAYGSERRIVDPRAGDEIGMLFPLDNGGPLGITILRVGQPFNPDGIVGDPLRPDETSAGRAIRATDDTERDWVELTPFALPADDHTEIRLTFDVLACATVPTPPGRVTTAMTLPVTFRVLGLTRTADVPLGYAVSIESLPHCP